MFISIICPTFNEEKFIVLVIESVLKQDFPKTDIELLIVDGRSNDKTRDIVKQYEISHSFIKLLDNPYKIAPTALNIGIKQAKGDIIIRIDAHCVYPTNYISTLVKYLFELNADNVGGTLNTLPSKDTTKCRAITIASSHQFGVGNSMYRVGAQKVIEVETVPFGCYHRDVFNKIGLFDEELIRNQDDEFNARLINNGGKIFLIPDLKINYYIRDSFGKITKMYYQYGLYKPLVFKKLGKPATIRQFFPSLFVLGLIIGGILSCFSNVIMLLYFFVIGLYFVIGLAVGFQKMKFYKNFKLFYYLPFTFLLIHLSYGWGYIVGIYKILTKSPFHAEVTR